MLQPRLPSLFRLPAYSQFEYRPRYYKERFGDQRKGDKRIQIAKGGFNRNPNISGQLRRERTHAEKKSATLSTVIRIVLILLFVAVCYYLAISLGLLWQLA